MAHVTIGRRAQGALGTGTVGDWARAVWWAWRNRRAAAQLARLDDRLLADIGLTRGDVEHALALPPWQDPTRELYRVAAERRRAWRRW